jgi:SAM-dependent methyltransferase
VFLRENEIGGKVAPWVAPGSSLLDVGSGTGRIARWLARERDVRPTMADLVEFGNRVDDFPFLRMEDPVSIPAGDDAFDTVMMLFVLHHMPDWDDQVRLVREAARVARGRLVIIEDTPLSRVDRAFNTFWDRVLNLRHGVPTPFTFRDVAGWGKVWADVGLPVRASVTYRALWPTLGTYHHTLFVLDA